MGQKVVFSLPHRIINLQMIFHKRCIKHKKRKGASPNLPCTSSSCYQDYRLIIVVNITIGGIDFDPFNTITRLISSWP